jgi:hypothetical protein
VEVAGLSAAHSANLVAVAKAIAACGRPLQPLPYHSLVLNWVFVSSVWQRVVLWMDVVHEWLL